MVYICLFSVTSDAVRVQTCLQAIAETKDDIIYIVCFHILLEDTMFIFVVYTYHSMVVQMSGMLTRVLDIWSGGLYYKLVSSTISWYLLGASSCAVAHHISVNTTSGRFYGGSTQVQPSTLYIMCMENLVIQNQLATDETQPLMGWPWHMTL